MGYDDMSPTAKVRRNRVYLTLVVAGAHFSLFSLGLINRLVFTVDSRYPLLLETLNNQAWIVLHFLCALAILGTLAAKRGRVSALGAATGVMGTWAFLSLLWGLTTPTPVSLVGPILGGGMAALSYLLCRLWAREPRSDNGRR